MNYRIKYSALIRMAIFTIALAIPFLCYSQTYKFYKTQNYHNQLRLNTATGEVKQIQDDGQSWTICPGIDNTLSTANRFNLNETQNMWTFIMLDSYTGKTWQVQFSVKGEDYMFYTPINSFSLAYPLIRENWENRFQLFETQNMWNFILLDSYTGRLWQVQYSSKDLYNLMCIPINDVELAKYTQPVFYIQPLTSMYQYYLVDGNTGELWKFQWSTKGNDYRWIEKM